MTEKTFCKPKEIAEHFGVTLVTVRRWVKTGKLRARQTPGGHSRIYTDHFREMIREENGKK